MTMNKKSPSSFAFVATLIIGTTSSIASAAIVIDDFSFSPQSVFTAASTTYSSSTSNQGSAWNNGIFPIENAMRRRTASANWTTRYSENQTLSEAARLARSAGVVVDTSIGRADFRMNGRITSGSTGLTYKAMSGSSLDLATLGTGIRIDGGMTTLTGFSNPILQGISLQVLLTDDSGDSSNFTWYGNTTSGGFNGLDGTLEATWSDFQPTEPGAGVDLNDISSIDVRLFYSYIGLASSPTISTSYSMDSIVLVPAPAAIALLAAMPFLGRRRRS